MKKNDTPSGDKKNPADDYGVLWDKPRKIEHYEKRFGIIAIEKEFITPEDLVKGLVVQSEEDLKNISHRLLGEIFFHMGLMTDKQVEEVLSSIFENTSKSDIVGKVDA
jgi:hypothetical protein